MKKLVPTVVLIAVALALPVSAGCSAVQPAVPSANGAGIAGGGGGKKQPEKTVEGTATLEAGVQRVSIDLSTGQYIPNRVTAKAGVPLEVTFGAGTGCVKMLVIPSFNIKADMTGGAQTFKLGSLAPGEYEWHCGMDMKRGVIVVQ